MDSNLFLNLVPLGSRNHMRAWQVESYVAYCCYMTAQAMPANLLACTAHDRSKRTRDASGTDQDRSPQSTRRHRVCFSFCQSKQLSYVTFLPGKITACTVPGIREVQKPGRHSPQPPGRPVSSSALKNRSNMPDGSTAAVRTCSRRCHRALSTVRGRSRTASWHCIAQIFFPRSLSSSYRQLVRPDRGN